MFASLTILTLQMCDSLTTQTEFTIYIRFPLQELTKMPMAAIVNPLPLFKKEKDKLLYLENTSGSTCHFDTLVQLKI